MDKTSNLKLNKPAPNDFCDIACLNENADVIDSAVSTHTGDATRHITVAERTSWNDANSKKHVHDNKSVLDTITEVFVNTWNGISGHIEDAVRHITGAERTAWNGKADKTYVDTQLAGKATSNHTHNYAGSSAVGGAATTALVCTGNAATATALQTARKINGIVFDGTGDVTITAAASGGTSASCTGNSATATKLQTARKINGTAFDGSGNITITAAANGGTASVCSGNAATATVLQTVRTIALSGGATGTATSFNGSANIAIPVTALDISKATAGTLTVARGGTGNTTGNASACNGLTLAVAAAAPTTVTNNRITFVYS